MDFVEILTLTAGESIKLGDLATVNLKETSKGQARFGIDAPRHVQVHREEIYQKIQDQAAASAVEKLAEKTRTRPTITVKRQRKIKPVDHD